MKCPRCGTDNPASGRYCTGCGARLGPPGEPSMFETRAFRLPSEGLEVGSLFAGRYRVVGRLGKGGMGAVYKAEDTRLKRHVALKFLPLDLTRDDDARERFIREARAASALDHPNICTIYEIDETEDGQLFMAMACYEGETLKAKIERGPLDLDEALDLAMQIAQGLARAHEAGIVHRDIKPANIIVTDRGEVRILDFGLAKLAGQVGITRMGTALGTVLYMSPEQAQGHEVDHRADIWSLGVMLYEMLTGELPFKGDRDQTVIFAILNTEPEPLGKVRPGLPSGVARVVSRALEKDPSRRYQSADDLLRDLRKAKYETDRLEGLFAGDHASASVEAAEVRPLAVITFENQTGETSYDYLCKAIPNLLITSLEQSRYLHVITWERMQDLLKQMGRSGDEVVGKDLGFDLCRREGIDSIVLGSFTKAGNVFATDVKVLDVASKRLLKSASAKGEGVDSILERQIDDLSREISRGVGLAEHRLEQSRLPIAEVTTTSMDAYNHFLKGRELYERLYNEEALREFRSALEIDPAFAVAHLYLGYVHGRMRETTARSEAYKKAKEASGRATKKERLYIEASYADIIEHDVEKRFRILKQIVQEYPDEKRAHHLLAAHYRVKKQFYQAVEEYQQVLSLDPNYGWAMNELGYMYTDVGDFDKAEEYFRRYAAVYPGDANPMDSMGELYFRMGRLDDAIAKYREVLGMKPDFYYPYWEIAYLYALKEDYDEAIRWVDLYIGKAPSAGTEMEGVAWRGFYEYWRGRFGAALSDAGRLDRIAERAGSMVSKNAAERLRGLIYCDAGDLVESRRCFQACIERIQANEDEFAPPEKSYSLFTADWIPTAVAAYIFMLAMVDLREGDTGSARKKADEIRRYLAHYADLLHGEALLAEGAYDKAITVCQKAPVWSVPYMSDTDSMLAYNLPALKDVLARALELRQELDSAIEEYKRLTTVDPKDRPRQLIHPLYHYRLANLYLTKGWRAKAVDEYRAFAHLWDEADAGGPEFHNAQAALKSLGSSGSTPGSGLAI